MPNNIRSLLGFFFFLVIFFPTAYGFPNLKELDQTINEIYHNLDKQKNLSMSMRLEKISSFFLGKPYVLGSLGEGETKHFDQYPLYRLDAFDCETFVTTMLALALATDSHSYRQCLRSLRYQDGEVKYTHRNHFTDIDWNENNQRKGYVKDITNNIRGENGKPISQIARAFINKPAWFKNHTLKNIRLVNNNANPVQNKQVQRQRLQELQNLASHFKPVLSELPYIPLTQLFNEQGQAKAAIFAQIPHGAIVEIVRPNWDLEKAIGTHLNISHLGLVFWQNGILYYRQASGTEGKVIDIGLQDYLKQALASPTIKGINIQVVLPALPLTANGGCKEIKQL